MGRVVYADGSPVPEPKPEPTTFCQECKWAVKGPSTHKETCSQYPKEPEYKPKSLREVLGVSVYALPASKEYAHKHDVTFDEDSKGLEIEAWVLDALEEAWNRGYFFESGRKSGVTGKHGEYAARAIIKGRDV